MKQEEILEKLLSEFGPEIVKGSVNFRDQITATVSREKILEICSHLKETP